MAGTAMAVEQASQVKLDRIAVVSVDFDGVLKVGAGAPPDPARTLDLLDLPQTIGERFGVHHVELLHAHFPSTEPSYLKQLRDRLTKARSQLVQIDLDFGGSNVSAAGFSARAQAIDLAKQWIDHAEALGCPRVLVSQGSLGTEVRQNAVDALKILADYGRAHKVAVSIENRDTGVVPPAPAPPAPLPAAADASAAGRGRGGRGGAPAGPPPPPATWQVVVEVAKAAGVRVTPNIGNFPSDAERAAGLRALLPLSSGITHCTVDLAKYNLADAVTIAKETGYKGLYAIQAPAAAGVDPYAATKAILDELVKSI
jgi:sugar phosphate isomerase/epimerase